MGDIHERIVTHSGAFWWIAERNTAHCIAGHVTRQGYLACSFPDCDCECAVYAGCSGERARTNIRRTRWTESVIAEQLPCTTKAGSSDSINA